MRTPTEFELARLMHIYDPVKAHEYYLKNRELKGRKRGSTAIPKGLRPGMNDGTATPPIRKAKIPVLKPSRKVSAAKAAQRKALQEQIQNLEGKLKKLEELIRKKAHEEAAEDRKSKAKKERAAKEADKPKSAAEKAEIARENKKYRDKHKQELKTKSKKDSGGSSSKSEKKDSEPSVSDLKSLATKVKGQIAVAKQKLAAL